MLHALKTVFDFMRSLRSVPQTPQIVWHYVQLLGPRAAEFGLDGSVPLWLGGPRLHALITDGVLLEPLLASCLSLPALARLARLVQRYEAAHHESQAASIQILSWPLSSAWCEPLRGPAHTEIMEIVNACLRAVGVYPVDPRIVHDRRGRSYFPLWSLDATGRPQARPPLAALGFAALGGVHWAGETPAAVNVAWKGREYLYAACQRAGQRIWAAEYPVMFHPHVRPRLGLRPRPWSTANASKRSWPPAAVHAMLRGGTATKSRCPRRHCGGYWPRVHGLL